MALGIKLRPFFLVLLIRENLKINYLTGTGIRCFYTAKTFIYETFILLLFVRGFLTNMVTG